MTKAQKIKEKDIIVSFSDSMSSEDVTGSCISIEYLDKNILLECGLHQGKGIKEGYEINKRKFSFKVKELDVIILFHNHIDHIGRVPLLYSRGCNSRIIVPNGSKKIIEKMWVNCSMILNGEAKILSKKLGRIVDPLFTDDDVANALGHVEELPIYAEHEILDGVVLKYLSSGHVAFGTSGILKIKKNEIWKTVYYTSDLGNPLYKNYYVHNLDKVKNADLTISECTYSNKEKSCSYPNQRVKDIETIKNVINQYCVEKRGKILIPVFAFHRAQQMGMLLYEMFHDDESFKIPIYYDSVLLRELNLIFADEFEEFSKVLKWKNMRMIEDRKERFAVMESSEPCIILSAGGMLQGGASVRWLEKLAPSTKNLILFCGYCGENTLGHKLKLKKQKTVTVNGNTVKNNIGVAKLKSFSSHIQYNELIEYLSDIRCGKIALHHSNLESKIIFKKELEEKLESKCNSAKVLAVNKSTKIRL